MKAETRFIARRLWPTFLTVLMMLVVDVDAGVVFVRGNPAVAVAACNLFGVAAIFSVFPMFRWLVTPALLDEWRWRRRERVTGYLRPGGAR